MLTPFRLLGWLALASSLHSAPLSAATVATFAGNGTKGSAGDGGPATQAQLDNPFGVVRGPDGNIWFCEYGGQRVCKVTADGKLHVVAGSGQKGYTGDGGPALKATFNLPHEIRFDQAGDLYIVDMGNNAVRKVTLKTGVITTFAGTGKAGATPDGAPLVDLRLDRVAQPLVVEEGEERIVGRCPCVFVCLHTADVRAEHHLEVALVPHREPHVRPQTVSKGVCRRVECRAELDGQGAEALLGDRREDSCPVHEVVVRRLVADVGASCHLAHGECVGTVRGDDRDGGIENRTLHVGVIWGLRRHHAPYRTT